MRPIALMLLVPALLLLWVGTAFGHVALMPGQAQPGEPLETQLVVTHGCGPDGTIPDDEDEVSAIVTVTMRIPETVTVEPQRVEGWSVAAVAEDGHTVVRWDSDDPEGQALGLLFDLVVTPADRLDGQTVWFPVVQDCVDGASMSWTETGGPAGLTYPAAGLTVGDPDAGFLGGSGGLPTWAIIGLAVLIALAAGTAVIVITGRGPDGEPDGEPDGGPDDAEVSPTSS